MDLNELRKQIDEIDGELTRLFGRRMEIAAEIARYKHLHSLPVFDPEREKQKLDSLTGNVKEGFEEYITALFNLIFEISRTEQEKVIKSGGVS